MKDAMKLFVQKYGTDDIDNIRYGRSMFGAIQNKDSNPDLELEKAAIIYDIEEGNDNFLWYVEDSLNYVLLSDGLYLGEKEFDDGLKRDEELAAVLGENGFKDEATKIVNSCELARRVLGEAKRIHDVLKIEENFDEWASMEIGGIRRFYDDHPELGNDPYFGWRKELLGY